MKGYSGMVAEFDDQHHQSGEWRGQAANGKMRDLRSRRYLRRSFTRRGGRGATRQNIRTNARANSSGSNFCVLSQMDAGRCQPIHFEAWVMLPWIHDRTGWPSMPQPNSSDKTFSPPMAINDRITSAKIDARNRATDVRLFMKSFSHQTMAFKP